MDKECGREVIALHEFLQDWLLGTLPRNDESFGRFSGVLGDGLVVISPRGSVTARDALLTEFEDAHGALADQDFRIWVDNYRCQHALGDHALVTYEEWHRLDGADSARLSTVLFRKRTDTPNGVEWLHVHETWLPDHAPAGGERFPEDADA